MGDEEAERGLLMIEAPPEVERRVARELSTVRLVESALSGDKR